MFDLTFGGRYSGNDQTADQINEGVLVGSPGVAQHLGFTRSSEGVFTYSVAPSFKPTRDMTLYARVAKGYRPGWPQRAAALGTFPVSRSSVRIRRPTMKWASSRTCSHHRLSLELTGFYIDWNNIQLLTVIDNFGLNANGGGARSKGVEFTATARPFKGLSLSANGAYVDAYLTKDSPPVVGGLRGDALPYTARFSSTLSADYERPLSDRLNGTAGVSWRYTGAR